MICNLKKFYIFVAVCFCIVMCGILTVAFSESANADTEPASVAGNLSFTISGKVVDDSTSEPIKDIYICGCLYTEVGDIITDDVRTDSNGIFTISVNNAPAAVMGTIMIYEGNDLGKALHIKYDTYQFALNNPISDNFDIGTVALHPLKTGYYGRITDMEGNGIENLYVEFLNPSSTLSPYACICVVTDASGNFVVDPANPKQGEWYNEPGLGVNASYNVVVSDRVPNAPFGLYIPAAASSESLFSESLDVVFNADGTNSYTGTNCLDIATTGAVHVTMYDREQTPEHCAMWKHQVYVDGDFDPNGEGWLGDSHLELPVGATISIEENNRLKVSHKFEGVIYDEYYTPYLYILDHWEEVGIDMTKIAKNWRLWKNVNSPTLDNVSATYFPGDSLVLDSSYKNVSIDVAFTEAPIKTDDDNPGTAIASEIIPVTEDCDAVDVPQTFDCTIYIFAIVFFILLQSVWILAMVSSNCNIITLCAKFRKKYRVN